MFPAVCMREYGVNIVIAATQKNLNSATVYSNSPNMDTSLAFVEQQLLYGACQNPCIYIYYIYMYNNKKEIFLC